MRSGSERLTKSRPLVVVSERLGPVTEIERRVEQAAATVRGAPLWTAEQIHEHARDASIIILGAVEPFDAEVFSHLPTTVAIVRRGVGYDNVDIDAATKHGVIVANVPDASVEEVSDHAVALLLCIERGIPWLDSAVRSGLWQRNPAQIESIRAPSRRFRSLTLGVVGLGRIGRATARKARALYGRTLGSDPMVTREQAAEYGTELVPLDELLGSADHISIHAPLLPSTQSLINADSLSRCRPGAVIVNTSRGGLVDEQALISAVESGHLRSAGLDVTRSEPLLKGDPLLHSRHIILTAHSAAISTTTKVELASRSVDAVVALLRGVRPESVVNTEVLDSPALRHSVFRSA